MIDKVDRLNDDFWTESELLKMDELVINPKLMDSTPKHICWYHLIKNGNYTGKAMLLAVESIVDGQEAVSRAVAELGLTVQIGEYGDEHALNGMLVENLYKTLYKYAYTSVKPFMGNDKVFNYESWMSKLI